MKIIGISGNATVGKDSFCQTLIELLAENGFTKSKRLAFADELKYEVDGFLKETMDISAFTTDVKEKQIIRPFLVWWGTDFRRDINKDHWINKLKNKIIDDEAIYIITDVRYQNEFEWLKENGGFSIFLDRLDKFNNNIPPANDYELQNNQFIKSKCNIFTTWQTVEDPAYKSRFIRRNVFGPIMNYIQQ